MAKLSHLITTNKDDKISSNDDIVKSIKELSNNFKEISSCLTAFIQVQNNSVERLVKAISEKELKSGDIKVDIPATDNSEIIKAIISLKPKQTKKKPDNFTVLRNDDGEIVGVNRE